MGAYRSKPLIEKTSNDGEGNGVKYGVSEMQGWRVTMEDAWTCLPNLDNTTSMFGVFDGHGGQEVSQYCSKKLASFITDSDAYKNGELKKSLDQAFRSIDESILDEKTIQELKELAGDQDDDEEDDEAAMLSEEATMPIEELLKRMKQGANAEAFERLVAFNGNGEGLGMENSDDDTEEISTGKGENGIDSPEDKSSKGQEEDVKKNGVEEEEENVDAKEETEEKVDKKDEDEKEEGNEEEDDEENEAEEEEEVEDSGEEDEDDDEENEGDGEEEDNDDDICVPESDEVGKDSGTTAIVALKRGDQLVVANVGDSRCVLCRGEKAFDMSVDHKPEDETETERITKAGGKITSDGRVNGGLNLSRAIGDHNYKNNDQLSQHEQVITAVPDVKETTLTDADDYMIIACDGIWNILSSQEAVDFVSKKLDDQRKEGKICLSKICEEIFDHCLAPDTSGDGSGCDNMTCIIVVFNDKLLGSGSSSRKRTEAPSSDEKPTKKQKVDQ